MSPHLLVRWSLQSNNADLKDAASDAIEKYWKKHEQFSSDPASYAYLNKCRQTKHKRIKHYQERFTSLDTAMEVAEETDEEQEERRGLLMRLIAKLPAKYRHTLEMECENKSPDEIAREDGITLDCYYQRHKRAVDQLKKLAARMLQKKI